VARLRDVADLSSAYLAQHVDNPVDWWAWGPDAFDSARERDRPVFLSVGYAACHWCHVMAHECFEDAAIAALLNESFVAIKVDREERPDVDAAYMAATQLMTGHGGWPMSVFLTPDADPFYAGTYFGPVDQPGRVGFPRLLAALAGGVQEALQLLRRHEPWLILGLLGYLGFDVMVLWATFHAFGAAPPMAIIWIGYLIGELGGLPVMRAGDPGVGVVQHEYGICIAGTEELDKTLETLDYLPGTDLLFELIA